MRKNVLIYPSNGYAAIEIYNCLKDNLRYKPILGCHGFNHGSFITESCYTDLPLISDPDFITQFNKFIADYEISFVLPQHDTVVEYLTRKRDKIAAPIVCSPHETAEICRHKSKTYELFSGYSFNPIIVNINNNPSYPFYAKDDVGQGGKKAGIINSQEELQMYIEDQETEYVYTEYLPGQEVTVDCFTNKNGELLVSQPRLRITILDGMSGLSETIPLTDEIKYIAEAINSNLVFRGYWYFQIKKDANDVFKLMEISTRFAGSFCISGQLDINFPVLALSDFEGLSVSVSKNNYKVSADRFYKFDYHIDCNYDCVYFDFDDTLVFRREKYNPKAMAFLFDCINRGIEVILLTKHEHNIHETLKTLHINEGLFSRIIEVPQTAKKADYINSDQNPILIDNSFKERMETKEKLGIPTFDICNIDCLIKSD